MLKNNTYNLYKNSLTIFSKNLFIRRLKYIFSKIDYYFDLNTFYDNIISFLLTLKTKKFYILTINKEFDLYNFKKYLVTKLKFIKKKLYIKKVLKTKLFKKDNNILIFFTQSNLFLNSFKKYRKIFKKLNKNNTFKINLVLFNKETLKISNKNIITKNFLSNLLVEFKNKIYIKSVIYNLKNLKLNIYSKPDIKTSLYSKIFNQNEIIESILANLNSLKFVEQNNKPIGSWLLCGPSGTGKTEIAKVLTYSLFNSMDKLIKIDMSEYSEKYSISKLIGSSPGYIGYGKDTVLSSKFKNDSSFVVLFDELEKADQNIINIMLQLLDEGRLTMSDGRLLDFTKSFIIFTSNAGYTNKSNYNTINKGTILTAINNAFKMEFLNRLNKIIVFNTVDKANYSHIFKKFIIENSIKLDFYITMDNSIKLDIIQIYCNKLYGSRPLKRFNNSMFNTINLLNNTLNYNSYYNLKHRDNCINFNTNIVL